MGKKVLVTLKNPGIPLDYTICISCSSLFSGIFIWQINSKFLLALQMCKTW